MFLLETRSHLVATRCCKSCMSRSEEVPPLKKRTALQSLPLCIGHHSVTAAASLHAVTRLPFSADAITERANISRRWCSHKVLSQHRVRCAQGFPRKGPARPILSWASEVVFHRRSVVSVAGQFLLRREARADRDAVRPQPSPRRASPVCLVVAARCRAPLTRGVSAVRSIARPPSRGRVGGMVRAIFSSVLRKRTGPRTCLLGCRQLPSASR